MPAPHGRSEQHPGVGRAFWEFVENQKMYLICSTPTKAYITSSNLSLIYKEELKKVSETEVPLKIKFGAEHDFDLIYLPWRTRLIQKFLSAASLVKLKFSPIQIT